MNFNNIKYQLAKERKEKPRMRILSYWAIVSFLGIVIIKTIIRPKNLHLSGTFDFLQGTLPNFFAGSGFCVIAFVYFRAFYIHENSLTKRLLFAFLFSFLGLTLWEFIQFFMGYPIDFYDILMTAMGNLLTIIIVVLLKIK
ncbi:hypothetical protein EC396_01405 [Lutibacter sp. HS1-25]|uniref:hypothetical protein n=1 Tax=Lutibacter sp. HS1-25 TaxID=2485000 RepID=UPI001010E286|nr:hypothetical protein [Lutibacter sp. HS1-25]RXP64656.1 hypothetical protein EC396_01405 [Lutibacter sp. HS1-25]